MIHRRDSASRFDDLQADPCQSVTMEEGRGEAEKQQWGDLYGWVEERRRDSSDRHSNPLAPISLLAGDGAGLIPAVSVAAVVCPCLDSATDDLAAAVSPVYVAGRIHAAATGTLVRGAIELAGLGMWALTGPHRLGRQQRALRVAHDSARNAVKFFDKVRESPGAPAQVVREATEAVDRNGQDCGDIVAAALALGLRKTTVTSPVNRTEALAEIDRSRGTDFLQKWQLFSGFAHGYAWAPEFFVRRLYSHELEGGGNIIGGALTADRAFAMLSWGRRAVDELMGTFAAERIATGGPGATLISVPPGTDPRKFY